MQCPRCLCTEMQVIKMKKMPHTTTKKVLGIIAVGGIATVFIGGAMNIGALQTIAMIIHIFSLLSLIGVGIWDMLRDIFCKGTLQCNNCGYKIKY